jgi:hypothetical protein
MHRRALSRIAIAAAAAATLGLPGLAVAYDEDDAIRDCNDRMRDEYKLSDFRSESAEKLPGEGHRFKVSGKTKIDGEKHAYGCDIEDRHVTAIRYDGPQPEGLDTAEKLAIGAAAAVAAGLAVQAMTDDGDAETPKAAAEAPEVRTLQGGALEVSVQPNCLVRFNDLGLRDSHDDACTAEQLAAADKAVNAHLREQRASK